MKTNCVLLFLLFFASRSISQAGSPDVSFADKGKLLTTTPAGYPSPVRSVICKKDGSLLAGSGELESFLLKQFLTNGSPDSSFGKAGEVRTAFADYTYTYISSLVAVDNNKIVAAGSGQGGAGSHNGDILLARYSENGTMDSSFGKNGTVVSDFNLIAVVTSMKITKEEKIVVAGYCQADDESKDNFFLAQYNADGSVDKSFGDGGKVVTDIGAPYLSQINSIVIAPDGGIIATGKAEYIPDFLQSKLIVAKYTSSGKPDTKFGNGGLVFTDAGENEEYGNAVALQPDGKIVVAGASNVGFGTQAAMLIVRYNADGSLDKSFNGTGSRSVYIASNTSAANSVVTPPSGTILLGGEACTSKTCDFELVSVATDGSIDSSFGNNGLVTTDFSKLTDQCYTLALQPDGKIVAAGGSSDNNFSYISIARYNDDKEQKPLLARIKRFLHNHGIGWQGLNGSVQYYSVQYSKTSSNFTEKGKVSGAGSSSFKAYEYDVSDAGCYRIVAVDGKGYKTFSNKIWVSEADVASAASVYPNPAKNYVTIQGLQATETANIAIKDGSGNVLARGVSTGSEQYRSQLGNNMQPGTYYLNVTTGSKTEVLKFVKE